MLKTEQKSTIAEIWKPIPMYWGWYEVSNLGSIRSLKYLHSKGSVVIRQTPRLLKGTLSTTTGYLYVTLAKRGYRKVQAIHSLVLTTFVKPRPSNKYCCDHIDRNKLNNSVKNLRWLTIAQNTARNKELLQGEGSSFSKLKTEDVLLIRKMGAKGFSNKELANLFGVHKDTIRLILLRETWKNV